MNRALDQMVPVKNLLVNKRKIGLNAASKKRHLQQKQIIEKSDRSKNRCDEKSKLVKQLFKKRRHFFNGKEIKKPA